MNNKGFTLFEILVTLLIIALLIIGAGAYWGWGVQGVKEKSFVNAMEDLVLRAQGYAQSLESPVAICISLSDGCVAEGMLSPRADQTFAEVAQEWHLLEALPDKDGVFMRSNLNEQRLIFQAGGLGVRQPGTIYVCSMNLELPWAWALVIARSGRVTVKKIEGEEVSRVCGLV